MSELADEPQAGHGAVKRQRIVRQRRQYNQWAANQTLEDFALRFTAQHARKFSPLQVANTALGSIAFLACEAIGATVALNYGFANGAWALLAVGVIFFATGLPICFYAAKYGVDMDLLTRGAGFGYLGSTITSAIYASFTFILFAFEAAILSAALHLCLGIPLALGHMISALIVIPFAVYGIKRISWLQNYSQPIWLLLQLVPLVYLATAGRAPLAAALGGDGQLTFNLVKFGGAAAVLLSLLPQIGEQVDYLRFLPAKARIGKRAWWAAVIIPGPGWILIGGVKIMLGAALAFVLLQQGANTTDAAAPTNMYHLAFGSILGNPVAALILTGVFVAICQLKINVTNAYAGSIASSNFFARLTHRHPGRVVWLVFNVIIALMLMEMGILGVVEHVLSLYANLAVAWIGAVTADLMINKPLGLSPKGIEFRRAYLHDVNPVGVGAMGLSVIASSILFFGGLGPSWQALSSLTGLAVAFVAAPAIAWVTRGKFYLARKVAEMPQAEQITCIVCENRFEPSDMAACPVYQGAICSLCCSLEARCHDSCKPGGGLLQQASRVFRRVSPLAISEEASVRLVRFGSLFLALTALAGVLLGLVYVQQTGGATPALREDVGATLTVVFMGLLIVSAFVSWFFVLAGESRLAAEEETERQTLMLIDEIEAHKRTDAELQRAKEAADAANLAKSRYIVGISHEIRTPLNAISGYAQLLERSPKLDPSDAARVIRRSAAHLGNLVDGLLDISRIENGSLHIDRNKINLVDFLNQIVDMFRLQAAAKGITFRHNWSNLPDYVYVDEKRLRQVLINLLSNAIKYTDHGEASLTVTWRGQVVEFIISDTGRGIAPEDHMRAFAPFERLGAAAGIQGVGLGLTISQLLVTVMGGDITLESALGEGSTFRVKMFMSEAPVGLAIPASRTIAGYQGPRKRILVTDDDAFHVDLVREFLEPLGFDLAFARDGKSCLEEAAVRLPDLVVLDIAMPGMSGWDAARALRAAHGDDLSIVMISANAHDFGVRREDDPHDDFLTKPYEVDALLERIQTQLGLAWRYGVAGQDAR